MKRTGLLHLYYGDGKGKTTAAMVISPFCLCVYGNTNSAKKKEEAPEGTSSFKQSDIY